MAEKAKRKPPHPRDEAGDDEKTLRRFLARNKPIIRFVGVTLVSLVALFYLLHLRWVERHFVDPYTNLVAVVSRLCASVSKSEPARCGGAV